MAAPRYYFRVKPKVNHEENNFCITKFLRGIFLLFLVSLIDLLK